MKRTILLYMLIVLTLPGCLNETPEKTVTGGPGDDIPFVWENANIYFLLTDRFRNGDPSNDINFERTGQTAMLRGFMGGDIKGVTQKIEEGYFNKLGITAIWITPFFEQIHGGVDEGTGFTYGFHGYWTKDWTCLDPNFGTMEDLAEFVSVAHKHGIRVLMDVIINHTGPVTEKDPLWPSEWVRTSPICTYEGYHSTVYCTLTDNLPDIRTENNDMVDLPAVLTEKWKNEGRYDEEIKELDAFFTRTGYPRAPRYYIIKWLVDYVKKFGIDGFRLDTAKHIEESVWAELETEVKMAFEAWKRANPDLVLDDNDFFMVGEVYNYGISGGRFYDFGNRLVDYFDYGMDGLINFEFKHDARMPYEAMFSKYDSILNSTLSGQVVVNYASSHDDGNPFDKERNRPLETGTRLLLCPGASQVYYGDETARPLIIEGTKGDATLRSFMNWDDITNNNEINGIPVNDILDHWQKLGRFRRDHPSVGAGRHSMISSSPYVFSRTYASDNFSDAAMAGLDLESGRKVLDVSSVFSNGTKLLDYYSGKVVTVKRGRVTVRSPFDMVLLGEF